VTISRKGRYHLFISRDEVQHLMINYFTLNGPRFTIEALSGTQCIGVHLEDQYSAFTMSRARCSPSFSQKHYFTKRGNGILDRLMIPVV
jgi:hypothetical protein